jgi:hypothetical protein
LHWAITSSGPETMNNGEPITGSRNRPSSTLGKGIGDSFQK